MLLPGPVLTLNTGLNILRLRKRLSLAVLLGIASVASGLASKALSRPLGGQGNGIIQLSRFTRRRARALFIYRTSLARRE